ncbi:phosphodiester glycosidase family protein [Sporosarcina aquimarina]|uniref:Phosphodiester glycosidase family protein n=1 Tax=Sporosarcina aquimarina TaxID=114975 RepID=A0ABU4FVX5_9BACL|nr:phosphodiester glycosidase family protein [Sporosarcina aquimarina]MDW0108858.1 phosphodiester glycosidase family protein [Sporosarcina aquimarina]
MFLKRTLISGVAAVALFSTTLIQADAAGVSQGVYHSKQSITVNGNAQTLNQLNVNLTQPYTTVDVGINSPFNKLATVNSLATAHTQVNHHVVGAINASLFHFSNGYPSYLLTKGKQIQHVGAVSTQSNDFMHTPAAFGMTADNKGKIGTYTLSPTIEHNGKSVVMTSLNRERNMNESILFTSSWPYETTRTNGTGLEVIVATSQSAEGGMALGEKVTGKVVGIRANGDPQPATVPVKSRGFVLSAHGSEVDKIRNMKVGDAVSISYNVDSAWRDSKFMLASGPLLVQNGKVDMTIDYNSSKALRRTARTAVATDASGKMVYFFTADSGLRGKSTGMTMKEFAEYMVSKGAYTALNLDGGGSTTMVTRKPGNVYPTLANRPSESTDRSVSAILEAISTAPYDVAATISASQEQAGQVGIGASVGFKVDSALDQYLNVRSVDQSKVELLGVSNGIGKIENNRFVGVKAGTGTVTVGYEKAKVNVAVTVTDSIDEIVFNPSALTLGTNESLSFDVSGKLKNQNVIFNSDAIKLSASGAGTLKGKTFTAGAKEGTATITATYGSKKKVVPVTVTDQPVQLGSFESLSGLDASGIRASASASVEKNIQAHDGNASVRLDYDFTANKEGISAAYLNWTSGLPLSSNPKELGVWVYGDGNKHWLRGSLLDAKGKEVIVDFTKEDGLDWTGWKYVTAKIPASASAPLMLQRIYVAERSSDKKDKGFLLFDKLQVRYSDKAHQERAFQPSASARTEAKDKMFTVKFTQPMDASYFTDGYVYVEDEFGVRQAVTVSKTDDARKVSVKAPAAGYASGKGYRLVVTHFAKNARGVSMVKDSVTEFKVK